MTSPVAEQVRKHRPVRTAAIIAVSVVGGVLLLFILAGLWFAG